MPGKKGDWRGSAPRGGYRLAEVLSEMEPFYHECLIDMYKVMVSLFFTPPP
jgi:hypothetical protein